MPTVKKGSPSTKPSQNASKERLKRKKSEDDEGTKMDGNAGEQTSKPSFLKDKDTNIAEVEENNKESDGPEKDVKLCEATTQLGGNAKDARVKWANALIQTNCKSIIKEYIKNKLVKPESYTVENHRKNEEKNRYNDILCIDATRVVLRDREDGKDYIHANWITLPNGSKYICTQGPVPESIEDFWHMVFTEKSTCIVMLCNLTEQGQSKCERYFPKPTSNVFAAGFYKIKFVGQKEDVAENISCFQYEVYFRDQVHRVLHYKYPTWTDHCAPFDPAPAVKLLRHVRNEAKDSPITVHCSAGIGRTSTFVGLELATLKIRDDPAYSMVELLRELRNMRFHAIQGPMQYLFLHVAILEYFAQDDIIKRTKVFCDYLASYKKAVERYERKVNDKNDSKKKKKKKKEQE